MGTINGGHALWSGSKEALRASAAFWSRIARAGLHVALCLEPVQRGINGADGNFAARAHFDLPPNGYSVGLITKTQNREKHDVLKFAEVIASGH